MKVKSTILILMILLVFNNLHAQNFVWAKGMGSPSYDEGRGVSVDASGNVLTIGTFYDTADFDPGAGITDLISAGGQDFFIQKLNANGNLLWAKRIGGTDFDEGYAITTDASGNIYTTGYFKDTVDFDPGPGTYTLTAVEQGDVFILKLDPSGNFLWAKRMGGIGTEVGLSIAVDPFGDVYTTGWFYDVVDFDPGIGVSYRTSAGETDLFVQKLDSNGNFLWAATAGGPENDYCRSVDFDDSGNVYAIGEFLGLVDFDPGAGITNQNAPIDHPDIYVWKLDGNGNFVWAKQMGGISFDYGQSITVDSSGNVYTLGMFQFTADFDPGPGTSNLTSEGIIDIFVQKLDTDGNFLWVKQIGGPGWEAAISIASDPSANIYITGYFADTLDFDPGPAVSNLTSTNSSDVFVQKMDENGNFMWAKQMGGPSTDFGQSIAVDVSGNTYVTGFFYDTVDFNPGVGTNNLISTGESDVFVQKMSACTPVQGSDTITACESYTWIDGVVYTSDNNNATHILTGISGCDSIITLNLTINHFTTGTDFHSVCNSYTWIDGVTYFSSNDTAIYTLTNSAGCDSVVTLNLVVNNSTGTDVVTACNNYTWIDGITYTSSNNTATDTLTNTAGCDSIVTLNLTINSVSDLTTSLTELTISSNNEDASGYRWLDCDNNYSFIENGTGIDFTATANGNYAVEITENGCVDTSACIQIKNVGVIELSNGVKVSAYPNPSEGLVYLTFERVTDHVALILKDVDGKVISTQNYNSLSNTIIELNEARGIYFLTIQMPTGQSTIKLVKE